MLSVLSNVIVLSKIDLFACAVFFIRDAEINLNFKLTCNLGQLWVSGGSLAVCVQYWHSLCFVQELTSNLMGFFVYKRCLELEMQKSAHGMVLETSSKSHFEFVAVLGLQDELMNLPVKSGLARSTQPREEKCLHKHLRRGN